MKVDIQSNNSVTQKQKQEGYESKLNMSKLCMLQDSIDSLKKRFTTYT